MLHIFLLIRRFFCEPFRFIPFFSCFRPSVDFLRAQLSVGRYVGSAVTHSGARDEEKGPEVRQIAERGKKPSAVPDTRG